MRPPILVEKRLAIEAGEIDNRERQILLCRSWGREEREPSDVALRLARWNEKSPGCCTGFNWHVFARRMSVSEKRSWDIKYIIKRATKGKVMSLSATHRPSPRNIVPRKVINARNPRASRQEPPFRGLDPISGGSRYFRAEMSYFFSADFAC